MYHAIVKKNLVNVFTHLSDGDYEYVLGKLDHDVEHHFAGNHCLGGIRTDIESIRKWFQRLYRLFPNLQFQIKTIAVSGWPWDTTAIVEWVDRATPLDGAPYVNTGAHVIKLRWGKVVSLHAYLDTQVVVETCRRLAEKGIKEAQAPPILS